MASMTEPIIVQIVNEAIGGASGPSKTNTSGGKSGAASIGVLAGGMSKILGMGAIIVEVIKLIGDALNSVIKPIKMMLGGIFKLIVQLLRPIADVITLLLMPFLAFLKPIIKAFNEIMRPYRLLAYRMMKTATESGTSTITANLLEAGAIAILLEGFAVALLSVLKNLVVTLIVVPLAALLWPIIDMFTTKTFAEFVSSITEASNELFDSFNSIVLDTAKKSAALLGVDVMGIDTSVFRNSVTGLIKSAIEEAARNATKKTSSPALTNTVAWTSAGGTQYGTYTQNGQGYSGVIPGTSSYDKAKAIFATNAKV